MYKPAPVARRRQFRPAGNARRAWAGNALALLLVGLAVLAVEYLPDLVAGWIF